MAKPQTQRQPNIRVLLIGTRLQKWRLLMARHPYRTGIIMALIVFLLLAGLAVVYIVYVGYKFNVGWIGLSGPDHQITTITAIPGGRQAQVYSPMKTLWDWLQLLIVPAVLAAVGSVFTLLQHQREQKLARDEQSATKFQAYIDFISKLLLEKNLLQSRSKDPISENPLQKVARAQTLTVLRGLDADRKGHLLTFLFEAELINMQEDASGKIVNRNSIVALKDADLREAHLEDAVLSQTVLDNADFSGARLSRANLNGASLFETKFIKADLSRAFLQGADLKGAKLIGAKLIEANLRGAILTEAELNQVPEEHLRGANLKGADLSGADLTKARLIGAILKDAILDGANLSEATYDDKQLAQAKSRTDLILHDGSKYSPP